MKKFQVEVKFFYQHNRCNAFKKDDQTELSEEDEEGDVWYLEQQVPQDEIKLSDVKYGFAQTKSNIFSKLSVCFEYFIIKIKIFNI